MKYLLFFLFPLNLFCQTAKLDTVFCDCENARTVVLAGQAKIGKTIAPMNGGEKQEISEHKQKTKYAFEKEHHTAWYKLIINTKGHMCFDVIPSKKDDDYDFMLFKAEKNGFCDSLAKYHIKPTRSCISRDKEDIDGKTGCNNKAQKEFVKEGVGDAYVSAVTVAKGEVYYLVVDNVYEKGEGHTIQFYFEEPVLIKGVITDEKNKPIQSEISLTNRKGDTILTTNSKADGSYEIKTNLRTNNTYVLNFLGDSSFIASREFTIKDSISLRNIRTILPKLKKGSKYPINTINFFGDSSSFLPTAILPINNLYKLMRKNKTLKILIEGHTNGNDAGTIGLSQRRANKIKSTLIEKGINEDRIKTIGKGGTERIIKNIFSEEAWQNRRVEVLVLEY